MFASHSEMVGLRYVDGREEWLPYTYVDGKWRRSDGQVLRHWDMVCIRSNGRFACAINPVTRQSTGQPQWFMVTRIDGGKVAFTPNHSRAPQETP